VAGCALAEAGASRSLTARRSAASSPGDNSSLKISRRRSGNTRTVRSEPNRAEQSSSSSTLTAASRGRTCHHQMTSGTSPVQPNQAQPAIDSGASNSR
jgi:hypothetical protein